MLILTGGAGGRQLTTWRRAIVVRESSVCQSLTQKHRVWPSTIKRESLWTMGAGSTVPPSRSASSSSGRYGLNSSRSSVASASFTSAGGSSTGSVDSSSNRAAAGEEVSRFL